MTYSTNKFEKGLVILFNQTQDDLVSLSNILTGDGYRLKFITDETEFLNSIESEQVTLILMNSYLASHKLCQQVKSTAKIQNIPVLFLLPEQEKIDSEKVFQIGGADYIPYPYKRDELLARVRQQMTLSYLSRENRKLKSDLEKATASAEQFSTIDSVTSLDNRRQLEDCLQREWLRCARERISFGDADQTIISIIICDLDYFTIYNEHYGYQLGNDCLKMIAETIKKSVKRPSDLVARYDGAKVAILLPNTDDIGALQVAKIIKDKIENMSIIHAFSPIGEYLTVSIGIASAIPSQALSADALIWSAERALLQAKEQGGNRIISDSFNG